MFEGKSDHVMGYRLIIATMCVGYLIGYEIGSFQNSDAVFIRN